MIRTIEFKPMSKECVVACCNVFLEDGTLIKNVRIVKLSNGYFFMQPWISEELSKEIMREYKQYMLDQLKDEIEE